MTRVLMILSAADAWTLTDGSKHPTGFWAEEFVVPHDRFVEAGWEVTVATPGATAPTVDEKSLGVTGGMPWTTARLRSRLDELAPVLAHPEDLHTIDADGFDVVFYPGGHGPMEDLAYDEVSGRLLARRLEQDRPLALLCHAPAAIKAAPATDGASPFAGRRMTGLSNAEETLNGLTKKAPWLLEDELKQLGVEYSSALLPFRPHVVVDGNLFTGQNPQSSEKLAQTVIDARG